MSLFMDKPSDEGGRPAAGVTNSARTVIRDVHEPVEERGVALRPGLSEPPLNTRSGQVGEDSRVQSTCRYLSPSSLLIRRQPDPEDPFGVAHIGSYAPPVI
jgi:hypothetical protein